MNDDRHTLPSDQQRLDDWRALCAWLEDRAYNASYEPRCQGSYLLAVHTLSRTRYNFETHEYENDPRAPAYNRYVRAIKAERKRLDLVFWSTGHGWRLRKDYKEKLDAEAARLREEKS